MGPLFRNITHRLVGVDLSRNMLALAYARGAYDELYVSPLEDALRKLVGCARNGAPRSLGCTPFVASRRMCLLSNFTADASCERHRGT